MARPLICILLLLFECSQLQVEKDANNSTDRSHISNRTDISSSFFYSSASSSIHQTEPKNSLPSHDSRARSCEDSHNYRKHILFYIFCLRQSYPIRDLLGLYFSVGLKLKHRFDSAIKSGTSIFQKSSHKVASRAAKSYASYTWQSLLWPNLKLLTKNAFQALNAFISSLYSSIELKGSHKSVQKLDIDTKLRIWDTIYQEAPSEYVLRVQERREKGTVESFQYRGQYRMIDAKWNLSGTFSYYNATEYFANDEEEETLDALAIASDMQYLPQLSIPPNITYPWPWNAEIKNMRAMILAILVSTSRFTVAMHRFVNDRNNESSDDSNEFHNESSFSPFAHAYVRAIVGFDSGDSHRRHLSEDDRNWMQDFADSKKCLYEQLHTYAYATGIPNLLAFKISDVPGSRFTSVNAFRTGTCNDSQVFSLSDKSIYELFHPANLSSVYEAARHFYTFPYSHSTEIRQRSAVTVYTPSLPVYHRCITSYLCDIHAISSTTHSAIPELQVPKEFVTESEIIHAFDRPLRRLLSLKRMIETAVFFEKAVLHQGLQAPSTVWYSSIDRLVDESADGLLIGVSESIHSLTANEMYSKLMKDLDESVLTDTRYIWSELSWKDNQSSLDSSTAEPEALAEYAIRDLIRLVKEQMTSLQCLIKESILRRDTDRNYQRLNKIVQNRAQYATQNFLTQIQLLEEQSERGAMYLTYETNPMNVLFRKLRTPHPLHLFVRLLIRFQESQLIRIEEVKRIMACAVMHEYNLSNYQC